MLFNTSQYAFFFLVVFALHWSLPQRLRRPFLLLALAGAVVVAGWIWAVARPSVEAWVSVQRERESAGHEKASDGREGTSTGRPYGVGEATVPPSVAWIAGVRERLDTAWLRGAYVFGLRPALYLGAILLLLLWPPHAVQRFIYFQF